MAERLLVHDWQVFPGCQSRNSCIGWCNDRDAAAVPVPSLPNHTPLPSRGGQGAKGSRATGLWDLQASGDAATWEQHKSSSLWWLASFYAAVQQWGVLITVEMLARVDCSGRAILGGHACCPCDLWLSCAAVKQDGQTGVSPTAVTRLRWEQHKSSSRWWLALLQPVKRESCTACRAVLLGPRHQSMCCHGPLVQLAPAG
ncbi:unnamed protein product [Lota lota]